MNIIQRIKYCFLRRKYENQIEMLQDQLFYLLQNGRERNKIVIDDIVVEVKQVIKKLDALK